MGSTIGAPRILGKRLSGKDRQAALASAKGACSECGIPSRSHLEAVEHDGKHVALCPFCFVAESIERGEGKGRLIWCPELTQAQLNNLVVACWLAKAQGEKRGVAADGILAQLYAKHYDIEDIMFDGASHPAKMAQALRGISPDLYKKRSAFLGSVRFLPAEKAYSRLIDSWKETEWMAIGEEVWSALYESARRIK